MLFSHTIDSYKASALNVHTNTIELAFLVSQARLGRVRAGAVVPVARELERRMRGPSVGRVIGRAVAHAYASDLAHAASRAENAVRSGEFKQVTEAIALELAGHYWQSLQDLLTELVNDPKQKQAIVQLANEFVAEAEIQGYHRSYVYYATRRFFFSDDGGPVEIVSASQIGDFFSEYFSGAKRKYKVILRGSEKFDALGKLGSQLGLDISEKTDQPASGGKGKLFLGKSVQYPRFLTQRGIEARDPMSALAHANSLVEMIVSTRCFTEHSVDLKWLRSGFVQDEDTSEDTILKELPSAMSRGIVRLGGPGETDVKDAIEVFAIEHLTDEASHFLAKALEYHRAALEMETAENQLLDLWAALEGFLPAPDDDGARITQYVSYITPPLNLTYTHKIMRYALKCLLAEGTRVRETIASVPISGDMVAKTCCLLVSSDEATRRGTLYEQLDRNPLLRFRCWTIHERFSSSHRVKTSILEHKERIEWHLQRIYSTRNQIAHSAEALPYLDTLVENLHSYLDVLILSVVRIATQARVRCSVASVLKLLAIRESVMLDELGRKDVACSNATFRSIVYGDKNPLVY